MLAPILDPAHRMADLQRDRGDGDVLRHDAVLAAEAAADVGRDDADLVSPAGRASATAPSRITWPPWVDR